MCFSSCFSGSCSARLWLALVIFVWAGRAGAAGPAASPGGKLLRSEAWRPFEAASVRGDFFVASDGDDQWSGTLAAPNAARTDGPFATVTRAQRAVRELKRQVYQPKEKAIDARYIGTAYPFGSGRDIVVFIREGFYALAEPLVFGPEDGGERVETTLPSGAFEWHHLRDHYVTYAAYPGEKPVLSGAVRVPSWQRRGEVWVAPYAGETVPALLANGRKQTLARTPNAGYFTLRQTPASTRELPFRPGDLQSWPDMEDNQVVVLLRWRTAFNAIERIDAEKQIAYLRQPEDGPGGHNGLLVVPPRYYVENVRALLDAPGEWFFDQGKHEISYQPEAGLADPNQAVLSVPRLTQLLQVRGTEAKPVRNLRFYGLALEGAKDNVRKEPHYYDPTPGCVAVNWEYAADCEFAHSALRACDGMGFTVGAGCLNSRIFRNEFFGLAQGALSVSGAGDLQSARLVQVTRETWIDHNVFDRCGEGGGITLTVGAALRTTISHNYFTRSGRPYTIDCGGGGLEGGINGDCVVEYNHFEDVQNDADDAGVIVVNGMTFNSAVRNNLIHRVHRGFFSDNVAFWFDNMSSNWEVRHNVYYDIEQAEMKTCGTYLSDNQYTNNFRVEPPATPPEKFIEGLPDLSCAGLAITFQGKPVRGALMAGAVVNVQAAVTNAGSSGVAPLALLIDGRIVQSQPFPSIRHNTRLVQFQLRLSDPGTFTVGIGNTPRQTVKVVGKKPSLLADNIQLSEERILEGEPVRITAQVAHTEAGEHRTEVALLDQGRVVRQQTLTLTNRQAQTVHFTVTPAVGQHAFRIANSDEAALRVLPARELDLRQAKLATYISPKAKPATVEVRQDQNTYEIRASGWDFYHAEDAYGTVFLKQLKGDFISVVKIAAFGERTSEWYRSGLFVRNDISRSFDVDRGSPGSVLMFSTPGRAGIEYDEFGDGCMHKASSENLPEKTPTPIWIRLERHGKRFTGAISLDGQHWIIPRKTPVIPGLQEAVDLGLAAGAPDQKQYQVRFEEWRIKVEATHAD